MPTYPESRYPIFSGITGIYIFRTNLKKKLTLNFGKYIFSLVLFSSNVELNIKAIFQVTYFICYVSFKSVCSDLVVDVHVKKAKKKRIQKLLPGDFSGNFWKGTLV